MLDLSHFFSARRHRFAVIFPLVLLAFAATPALAAEASTRSADLATTLTHSVPTGINPGVTISITVTNKGPNAAQNVVVTDTASPILFLRGTAAEGATCAVGGSPGHSMTCTTPRLASGSSIRIKLGAGIACLTERCGKVEVSDTAGATSTTFDPNTANNTAGFALWL